MSKKIASLFFALAVATGSFLAHAEMVGEDAARAAAEGFLSKSSVAKTILVGRSVDSVEAYGNLWIVHLAPSGHIVVSGTTKCAPIAFFSTHDFVEPEVGSPFAAKLTGDNMMVAEKEADEDAADNADWAKYTAPATKSRRLLAAAPSTADEGKVVGPLLGAAWHQGAPYSDFTPLSGPCGCAATAGGQEHRYWRWPYRFEGSREVNHSIQMANGAWYTHTIRANGLVPFDWDKICSIYSGALSIPDATDKVTSYNAAYLTLWMQSLTAQVFKRGSSGATQKLRNFADQFWFERDPVEANYWRDGYTNLWLAIKRDLDWGSPIQVNSPVHVMVVDGYAIENEGEENEIDYINLNYGWGGAEGWVNLKTAVTEGTSGGRLADFQTGYRPQKKVQFEPLPKVCTSDVTLKWHMAPCYTNRTTGFTIEITKAGGATTSDTITTHEETTTYTATGLDVGGTYTFTVTPIMGEGQGEGRSNSVTTTIGTPQAAPTIGAISSIAGGLQHAYQDIFVECARGITNNINVTCSTSVAKLDVYSSHLTVLPDNKVSAVNNGSGSWTVKVDATAMDSTWDGDMVILTLVAANSDGTEAYKNLVIRLNSMRQAPSGTLTLVETSPTAPVWFGGTTTLDGDSQSVTFGANALNGNGTVTLQNGTFAFDSLDGFTGTLKWAPSVTVNLPADMSNFRGTLNFNVNAAAVYTLSRDMPSTAKIVLGGNTQLILDNVRVDAAISGAGTLCINTGNSSASNLSGFTGKIIMATALTLKAGQEKNVTIESGTLILVLDKVQAAYGYSTTQVKYNFGTIVFKDEDGNVLKTFTDEYYLDEYAERAIASSANTWTPDSGTGTGNFWDAARWSQGLPSAGDYVIFNDTVGDSEMTLNLSDDFNLGYVLVTGTKLTISGATGTATLSVDTFRNTAIAAIATLKCAPTTVVPEGKLRLQSGLGISCDVDSSLADNMKWYYDDDVPAMYFADIWKGTVVFAGYAAANLDLSYWANNDSVVRLNGVTGYLKPNTEFPYEVELIDNGETSALNWSNGSSGAQSTFDILTGTGTFQTTAEGGNNEKVLIKDISGFTGSFNLAAKNVAIADAMPEDATASNGRLYVEKEVEISAGKTWAANGGLYLGADADLTVSGAFATGSAINTYGAGAVLTIEDGGSVKVNGAISGDNAPTLNFKAGTYQITRSMTETKTVNFCADAGRYTTLDANGNTFTLGANFFSDSGDVYLTSSSSGGSFNIQGIPAAYTGTIYVDSTVALTLPSDLSSMGGKINISEITLARSSAGLGKIDVGYGATLQVSLTDDEAMDGLTVTGVTLNGGTIEFVDQRGTVVGSSTESLVYVKPEGYTVPSPEATAIWYNNFDATNDGYALTDWQDTHGANNSSITIDKDNIGLFVDFASAKGYFTVLVKYSNLSASSSKKRVLFATTATTTNYFNRCGIRLLTDSKVQGLWNDQTSSNNDADYGSASSGTVPSAGTFAFVYDKTSGDGVGGLSAYVAGVDETLPSTALWSNTALKAGDQYGFAVGGNCRNGSASGVEAAKGMTITGLAIFDRVLTSSELKYFRWEDDEPAEEPEEPEITYEVSPEQGAVPAVTKMTVTCSDPTATIWYKKLEDAEYTEYTEPVALTTGINYYYVKVNDGEATLYTYVVSAPEPEYEGPDPIAVWVAGEFDDDKSAHGGLEFALNGNTIDGNGNIVIGNSATLGATIAIPAGFDNATMLVKYEIPSGGASVDKAAPVSMFVNYDLGAYANSGLTNLDGYWWNNSQVKTDYPFSSSAPSIPQEGYLLISAPANSNNNSGDHYTAVYVGTSVSDLSGGEANTVDHRLRFTGADNRVTSVGVGGPTVAGAVPWSGMVIKSVAIFDEWVSTNVIANYKFPAQGAVRPEDPDRYVIEPVASWVNDFKTTEKGDYTLSVSGTTAAKDDTFGGTLTIGDAAAVIDATSSEAITVLVKYRTAPAIHSAPVVTFGGQAAVTFDSGICTDTNVVRQLSAYYSFIYGDRKRGIYAVSGTPTLSADGGYLVCARKTNACLAYVGDSLDNMTGGECTTDMTLSNSTLKKIGIGGRTELSSNDENMVPFTGFVVEKVVVFNGYYTPDQIRYIPNPEDGDTVNIASGATWNFAAGETRTYTNIGSLNEGGTIAITNASELTEGSYMLATWTKAQQYTTQCAGYGKVGTLVTDGLAEGLSARLIYGAKAIYLRVDNDATQEARKPIVILPYGDSITEGFNAQHTGANYRILLYQKLELLGFKVKSAGIYGLDDGYDSVDPTGTALTGQYRWHSAKHGAVTGRSTATGSGRGDLEENVDTVCAQAGKPDAVLLHIGINDLVSHDRVDTTDLAKPVYISWSNVVWRLVKDLPETKIVVSTVLYGSGGQATRKITKNNVQIPLTDLINDFNDRIKNSISDFPEGHVFLADLNAYVKSTENGILYDGTHPDWWGYDQMAEGWLSVITNQFSASQSQNFPSATPIVAPTSDKLGAAAKEELADYINGFKRYAVIEGDKNILPTLETAIPYSQVNNDAATTDIKKVGYFVEYVRNDNNVHKWVWVDMDAFGDTIEEVGLPKAKHQCVVSSLHVKSNHGAIDDVPANDDNVKGFVEFSPFDYSAGTSNVEGGPKDYSCYDWNDTLSDSGSKSCMQVHRIISSTSAPGGQVLFAYNNWRSGSSEAEFGIGNFSQHFYGGTKTFDYSETKNIETMNAAAYSVKRIEIWTKGAPAFTDGSQIVKAESDWFKEDMTVKDYRVGEPQTTDASWEGATVSNNVLKVDTDHSSPVFYNVPAYSGVATTYRIETVIDKLYVNTNTNSLPDYTSFAGEGKNPYASIAAAVSDEEGNPSYWYGWNGADWNKLGGSPEDEHTYTNAIEFTVKDSKLNVTYFVNGTGLGVVTNDAVVTLPTLSKLGFSGYGDFSSILGKGIAAFVVTTKWDQDSLMKLLDITDSSKIGEALNGDWDNGLKAWQNIILGIGKNIADEGVRPYLAPVQNAAADSLSFTVGNCAPEPEGILDGVAAKFQVYEVSRTGEAIESGITSVEELVGDSASVNLSGETGVKYFKVKIRIEPKQ